MIYLGFLPSRGTLSASLLVLFVFVSLNFNVHAQSSLENDVLSGKIFEDTSSQSSSDSSSNYDSTDEQLERSNIDEDDLESVDETFLGPRQIPFEQVLVVQKRFIRKAGSFELTPVFIGLQPADSFRKQLQWGFGVAYHLSEQFAWEILNAHFVSNFRTGVEDNLYDLSSQKVDRIEPAYSLSSSLIWSPFSSKSAAANEVWYFEGFLLAGGGISRLGRGSDPLAVAGVGARIYVNESAIMRVEFRNYFDLSTETFIRPNIILGASLLLGNVK